MDANFFPNNNIIIIIVIIIIIIIIIIIVTTTTTKNRKNKKNKKNRITCARLCTLQYKMIRELVKRNKQKVEKYQDFMLLDNETREKFKYCQ